MAEPKAASDILSVLILSGLMGMVGQGARTIVGLKKLSDATDNAPSQADAFEASRIVVGLMIGFVAGIIAGLSLKVLDAPTIDVSLLLGLAAAGYAGTDFIEGFAQTLGGRTSPVKDHSLGGRDIIVADRQEKPPHTLSSSPQKPAGRGYGFAKELAEAQKYKSFIEAAAAQYGVDKMLVYAVGSRESAWGLTLKPPGPIGTGDWAPRHGQMPPDHRGWGRGLMQADYAASEFAKGDQWSNPEANIDFGTNELASNIEYFKKSPYPGVDSVRAGIAAYNCGRGNVHKAIDAGHDVDRFTTGNDYSRDVMTRAEWFSSNA